MTLRVTAPTDPWLAERYREQRLWPEAPLREGLERIAEIDGERVAVIDNQGTWTYAELRRHVEAGVGSLAAAGVQAGDPVVVVAPIDRDAVATILAVIRAGGVAVVVDRRSGALDLANAVTSSGARHVIVPDELRSPLRVGEHPVTVLRLSDVPRGRPDAGWPEPDPDEPRLVIFTSGTTNRAKGVIHTLHTMGVGARNLRHGVSSTGHDRFFTSSPLATMTGLSQVFAALEGGSILLENRFHAGRSLAAIERHRATVIGGTPIVLEQLFAEYERQQLGHTSLERVALGGTTIPRAVLEVAINRFGVTPTRCFGMSEASMHACSTREDTLEQRLADEGRLLPGCECRLGDVVDGAHELHIRGPNMFQGYLYEEDNEGVFDDEGWFRTGDLVEFRGGRLRVVGRLKDVAARKGLKISLAEIDSAARVIQGVAEAAAYAERDEETGERVTLALHGQATSRPSYADVTAQLLDHGLARGKLPEEIVYWDEPLPRNGTGKVVRAQLRAGAGGRPREFAPRLAVKAADGQAS